MAVTKMEIIVTGLAFCRPVAPADHPPLGELQVLFLHPDRHHNLELTVSKETDGILFTETKEILGRENLIRMNADPGTATITGTNKPFMVDLFNLHFPSTVTMKAKNPCLGLSYLSIPTDDYFTKQLTSLGHSFWRFNPGLQTKIHIPDANVPGQPGPGGGKKIGKELFIGFIIPEGKRITMNFDKPFGKSYNFEHDPQADVIYRLKFDNECHDPCINDFGYYYEVVTSDGGSLEIDEVPVRPPLDCENPVDSEAACNPVIGKTGCDLLGYYNGQPC